jgi:hypothetical protein
MEILISILVSLLVGVALMEVYAWLNPLARWLVGRAARQLPDEHRDAFTELWTADLENIPNSLAKIIFAYRHCTLAVRAVCDEIRRDKLQSMVEESELYVNDVWRVIEDNVERSRSLLQQSERALPALVSELNRSLEDLQNQQPQNPDAQNAIDRCRVLSPPVKGLLSDWHARLRQDVAVFEDFVTRLREPLTRASEATIRLKKRLLDDKPIDSDDAQLLKALSAQLHDVRGAFDGFDKEEFLDAPDVSPALATIVEAFQAATRAVKQG